MRRAREALCDGSHSTECSEERRSIRGRPYPYIIIELEGATRAAQARTVTRDKEENPAYGEKEFVLCVI